MKGEKDTYTHNTPVLHILLHLFIVVEIGDGGYTVHVVGRRGYVSLWGIEREKKNIESKLSPPIYNLCGRGLVLTVRLDRNKIMASCDLHPLSEIDSVRTRLGLTRTSFPLFTNVRSLP